MKVKTKIRAGGLSANHNVTVKRAKHGVKTSRVSRRTRGGTGGGAARAGDPG